MVSSAQKVLDDVVVNLEQSGKGIETKELTKEYAMTAIMAAGFNIGKLPTTEILKKQGDLRNSSVLLGVSLL